MKLVSLKALQRLLTGGYIDPAVISPVELEPFLPLKWACDKPLCEISSTGLVFLLQYKAQKNAGYLEV